MTMILQTISSNLPDASRCYYTASGIAACGDSRDLLRCLDDESVSLIMTSPPFALQRKKEYGNEDQDTYVDWLMEFGRIAFEKLRNDGSLVIDLGGAYQKGKPIRSLYNFKVLIRFCEEIGFNLSEEFYWHNPSKLPSPIEWVNKRKIRAKDSVNTVWWLSKSDFPKADISKVLVPYSERMKKLLSDPEGFYTPKKRPSGHDIGSGFAIDNGGAIPSNLLQISNSESNSTYQRGCKAIGVSGHPARFPEKLPEFFIKFLTDPNDLVVDIFAGSNTTGSVAEKLGRKWVSFDLDRSYIAASSFRFAEAFKNDEFKTVYDKIIAGEFIKIDNKTPQITLKLVDDM
jgi:DNA modification methylase